jgi:hypothetical protein
MATIQIGVDPNLGNELATFMLFPELIPGDQPSYEACKIVYAYHPLGAKMAESPITLAQSQEREIAISGAPKIAVEKFTEEFKQLGCDEAIRQTKTLSRVYGIASCGIVAEGVPADRPLLPKQMRDLKIAVNVWDPLNTAGSLVMNQNPNAVDFMKQNDRIAVAGTTYHPSRTITVVNERPVYILYTPSAFGFVGRSVYQRAWFPLKSFLKTMITDDMVATKAGVIVAKIKAPGSIADNIMAVAMGQRRNVVKEAKVGNVINVGIDEAIESLNLQNLDAPMTMARDNILKNCATACDMPALILNEETYVEGFGEGQEDAKRVAKYIERIRVEMDPQYEWFDEIVMHRAWSPEFYLTIQRRYPQVFGRIGYVEAFYAWKDTFSAKWPNLLIEPDSEKVKTEEVVLRSAIAAAEVLLPISDPDNQVAIASWLTDTFNDQTHLFHTPLEIDIDSMEQYLQQMQQQAQQGAQAGAGGGEEGQGGGGGQTQLYRAPQLPKPPHGSGGGFGRDSMDSRVPAALAALDAAVQRMPQPQPKARVRTLMDALAKRSGTRG